MDEPMKYEMRIPRGVSGQILATLLEKYPEITIKQSEDGPYLLGEKEKLEEAKDYIVKALNERLNELNSSKPRS